MKNTLVLLVAILLTAGGCARPINQGRAHQEQRQNRRPAPDRDPARGERDNRPSSY